MFGLRKNKDPDETDRPSVCRYCENASELRSEDEMLCKLRGVVEASHVCRKFRYDPLKRKPLPKRELPAFEAVSLDADDNTML